MTKTEKIIKKYLDEKNEYQWADVLYRFSDKDYKFVVLQNQIASRTPRKREKTTTKKIWIDVLNNNKSVYQTDEYPPDEAEQQLEKELKSFFKKQKTKNDASVPDFTSFLTTANFAMGGGL